ncbi:gluconate 5-dehydrogenase [Palleronia aestuarii]|uniref:Gluconate 5-dehydrogenase n=1 Tax=Palleronia aestuarii TaxID=568105 RepID=A0A2W7N1U1_9RHOB|nr:SDR family NAD(P)-dependent oxidoreductase [Palleronia aestuarii]PZX13663.1 gluconate 5-dehydrogenase [Palleronia aestuarii]
MTGRFDLSGQRAFVTGGSRGLGREMALAFAEAGADVAIAARDPGALDATADEIRALGRQAWTFPADLGSPEAVETLCAQVIEAIGAPRILVNNVGGRRINVATEALALDTWREMIDLNLTATYICSRRFGAAMIEAGKGGRILNLASINAFAAGRGIGGRHYETAKAAVVQFTRTLAVDWARHGITANAICPGIFATEPNRKWQESNPEMIAGMLEHVPMGRMGDPREIGTLAVYLASADAGFMTGASLVIDGGYTCL